MTQFRPNDAHPVTACRGCGSAALSTVLDLGEQPPADLFPLASDPGPDPRWPLGLLVCGECWLLQLSHTSPAPDEVRAVESETIRQHAHQVSARVVERIGLGAGAQVLEFSSAHGGSWLEALRALGLDAREAQTLRAESGSAESGSAESGSAETVGCEPRAVGSAALVIDNHDLIHSEDIAGAFAERAAWVSADGYLVIEFHHALAQVTGGQYDTVRHGHPVYFSLQSWRALCERHGFTVVDAWSEQVYGGCLVVVAQRRAAVPAEVPAAAAARLEAVHTSEVEAGLRTVDGYAALAEVAVRLREQLQGHLTTAAAEGRRVLGYGAGSKAGMLLGAAGIDAELLEFTADLAPAKQGRRLPGSSIQILSPEQLVAEKPDEVLVLLWDLAPEVVCQLRGLGLTKATYVVPGAELRTIRPGEE